MSKNLVLNKDNTQKNTFFVHFKKSDFNDFDDLIYIKNLLDEQLGDNIDITDIKLMSKTELDNKSHKYIGKYMRSAKCFNCSECHKIIESNNTYKKLCCGHRFHLDCIDNKLKNDIYKRCSVCQTENISNFS